MESTRNFPSSIYESIQKNRFFCVYKSSIQKERMMKIMGQFNIYKTMMKYLTDKNPKSFLSIILFQDEIVGTAIEKLCADDQETIKDALFELRIKKYVKYYYKRST